MEARQALGIIILEAVAKIHGSTDLNIRIPFTRELSALGPPQRDSNVSQGSYGWYGRFVFTSSQALEVLAYKGSGLNTSARLITTTV